MTNIDVLKNYLSQKIHSLSPDELYDVLSSNLFNTSLCKYCSQLYEPCPDSSDDDSLCRERFKEWCFSDNIESISTNTKRAL